MAELNARIKPIASATAAEVPLPADIEVAELAVNTADGKLYTKHTDNSIVLLSGSGGGGGGAVDSVNGQTGVVLIGVNNLIDADTSTNPPSNGEVLEWDQAAGKWVPGTGASATVTSVNGEIGQVSLGIQDMNDYRPIYTSSTPIYRHLLGDYNLDGEYSEESTDRLRIKQYDAQGSQSIQPTASGSLYVSADGINYTELSVSSSSSIATAAGGTSTIAWEVVFSSRNPYDELGIQAGESLFWANADPIFTAVELNEGELLKWDSVVSKFRPSQLSIDELSDVNTTAAPPSDGQLLAWNSSSEEWEPADAPIQAVSWSVTANGTSDYIFAGDGFAGTELDPELYVVRGQNYRIQNTTGAHPFQIQSTAGLGGTAYSDGITNNGVSNGVLEWEVRLDSPAELYYQCTTHADMGGTIRVLDGAGGSEGLSSSRIGSSLDYEPDPADIAPEWRPFTTSPTHPDGTINGASYNSSISSNQAYISYRNMNGCRDAVISAIVDSDVDNPINIKVVRVDTATTYNVTVYNAAEYATTVLARAVKGVGLNPDTASSSWWPFGTEWNGDSSHAATIEFYDTETKSSPFINGTVQWTEEGSFSTVADGTISSINGKTGRYFLSLDKINNVSGLPYTTFFHYDTRIDSPNSVNSVDGRWSASNSNGRLNVAGLDVNGASFLTEIQGKYTSAVDGFDFWVSPDQTNWTRYTASSYTYSGSSGVNFNNVHPSPSILSYTQTDIYISLLDPEKGGEPANNSLLKYNDTSRTWDYVDGPTITEATDFGFNLLNATRNWNFTSSPTASPSSGGISNWTGTAWSVNTTDADGEDLETLLYGLTETYFANIYIDGVYVTATTIGSWSNKNSNRITFTFGDDSWKTGLTGGEVIGIEMEPFSSGDQPLVDGDILQWRAIDQKFKPAAPLTNIGQLSDVDTSTASPVDKQVLAWNETETQWEPSWRQSGRGDGGDFDSGLTDSHFVSNIYGGGDFENTSEDLPVELEGVMDGGLFT